MVKHSVLTGLRLLGLYAFFHFLPNASVFQRAMIHKEALSTHLPLSRCMTLDKSRNRGFSFLSYGTEIMVLPCQLHGVIVLNEKILGTVFWKLLHALHMPDREAQPPVSLVKGERRLRERRRDKRRGKIDHLEDTWGQMITEELRTCLPLKQRYQIWWWISFFDKLLLQVISSMIFPQMENHSLLPEWH